MKETVNGVILILSCQKHLHTRLKEFKLNKSYYNNYKVIYVIGDLFMDKNYELKNNNYLWIKCEDSYIHLLKKLVLSLEYIYEIYNIKEWVLRCGDDLIFNENNLIKFLKSNKYDYYGKANKSINNIITDINILKNTVDDYFMVNYYLSHKEDFDNPHHNIKNVNIEKYIKRPKLWGAAGVIYYLSNKSCNILIKHMQNINYDIFNYDTFSNSYPYTIEDCGVSFIMYYNKINFINNNNFFDTPHSIAKHTNKYK
jgi:hypothetical protein